MDIVRSFKRGVVENKNLIFFSIVFSCLLRIGFFVSVTDYVPVESGSGYLWKAILQLNVLSDRLISAALAFASVIGIALYLGQINAYYALIRTRTYIVPALVIVVFSLHPAFLFMTPQYIGVMSVLLSIYILLSTYHHSNASGKSYSIGFFLAVGSLFSFYTLTFLPLFLIGLSMMRCLRFKAVVAMLLGVASIYWLAFFIFLVLGDTEGFVAPFRSLYPILDLSFDESVFLDLYYLIPATLLGCFLFFYYQANSFQDKIRIRTNLMFFYLCFILSILSCWFILYDPWLDAYLIVISGVLLLSHFLSLAVVRWKVIFFYLLILLSAVIYIYNL